jgi:hypothetical protein
MIQSNFKEALLISSSAAINFLFNNDKTGHSLSSELAPNFQIIHFRSSYTSNCRNPFNCFSLNSTSCFWQYLYPRLILFLILFKEVHTLQQCHRMRMHFHNIFYCLSFKCHQILMNPQVMLSLLYAGYAYLLKHN